MSRLLLTFECQGKRCGATLDSAPGTTGLIIVSGGNETRAGAFNGQAHLAAEIAAKGFPVFRFDRRGIGDSEGENRGFLKSGKDIAAALQAFQALAPQLERVIAFGNCDAASALMLYHNVGMDGLILSNPATDVADNEGLSAPSAVRSRYFQKVRNRSALKRLLSGQVKLLNLLRSLGAAIRPSTKQSSLTLEMRDALQHFDGSVRILLAENDRTAQIFADRWGKADERIKRCPGASHSYVEAQSQSWLREQVLEVLRS